MGTYIILTRVSPQAFKDPKEFRQMAANVSEKIKSDCSEVVWKDSYVTMGRFDVVDIVESDDPKKVEKAAMIIRALGHLQPRRCLLHPGKSFLK
jgi:uncharacterized protein with GYD domain